MIEFWDVVKVVLPLGASLWLGWRIQLFGKRRFEVAEVALVNFALAAEYISSSRSPFSVAGEGSTRPAAEGEEDEVRNTRNAYWVPIERLNRHAEAFAPLDRDRLLCKYLFGDKAAEPFDQLRAVMNEIKISASSLIRQTRAAERLETEKQLARRERLETIIWGTFDKDDVIQKKIDTARTNLELHLKPSLRQYGSFAPILESVLPRGR